MKSTISDSASIDLYIQSLKIIRKKNSPHQIGFPHDKVSDLANFLLRRTWLPILRHRRLSNAIEA